jgi:LmbE family N-acetylglucosaminyl deacetylase
MGALARHGSVAAMLDDQDVNRILVVTAHPDDVDFGAAGSVARWTSEGVTVAYCVVTDGDAGGFDERIPRSDIPALRRSEQLAAAAVVGVSDVTFLGYPDGRLTVSIELRGDIARVIRRVRPQRVVCPSPQRMWDRIFASHPDHLAAGEAALCAVYPDARNPFAHPELMAEGLEPWSVDQVWLSAHDAANRWVDITATIDRKALRCHARQLPDPSALDARMRGWSAATAESGGFAAGLLAEAFYAIDTAG